MKVGPAGVVAGEGAAAAAASLLLAAVTETGLACWEVICRCWPPAQALLLGAALLVLAAPGEAVAAQQAGACRRPALARKPLLVLGVLQAPGHPGREPVVRAAVLLRLAILQRACELI